MAELKYEFNTDIDRFLNKFVAKVNQLNQVEGKINDSEIIALIFAALPPELNAARSAYRTTVLDDTTTWKKCMESFRAETLELEREADRNEAYLTTTSKSKNKRHQSNRKKDSKGKDKDKDDKKKGDCYCVHCKFHNHWTEDCWFYDKDGNRKRRRRRDSSSPPPRRNNNNRRSELPPPAKRNKEDEKKDSKSNKEKNKDDIKERRKRSTAIDVMDSNEAKCYVASVNFNDDDTNEGFHIEDYKRNQKTLNTFFGESGSTHHMSANKHHFINMRSPTRKMHVKTASGEKVPVIGVGTVFIRAIVRISGSQRKCRQDYRLKDVLYAPGLIVNLISIRLFAKSGFKVVFEENGLEFINQQTEKVVMSGTLHNSQYQIDMELTQSFRQSTRTISNTEDTQACLIFNDNDTYITSGDSSDENSDSEMTDISDYESETDLDDEEEITPKPKYATSHIKMRRKSIHSIKLYSIELTIA